MRAITIVFLLATSYARADGFSLGAFVGVPGEGSGPPIGGKHVPVGIVGRYELAEHSAIAAGLGIPIATVGASTWAGLELRVRPFACVRRIALYAAPGLRAGFVGPGYYARYAHVFVGFEYIYSGPWTIAPRLPIGITASVGRVQLFIEALPELPLLPGPELLIGGSLGLRVDL
ncbi:MAG TPA: hypothetical protein VL326_29085 [Kofleriaceae bacterium]|jgi:hypothetical protein|nr:hypothetical protein [Kofleriaceae bacterium]